MKSSRVSQLFNNTFICRYPRPHKVVFDNGYDLKKDFTPLRKDFDIKPVLTTIKNPQANVPVKRIQQVILNMLVTKDLVNNLFEYICPWGETLSYVSWVIRSSYHLTIKATPGQSVFGIFIIFNLT